MNNREKILKFLESRKIVKTSELVEDLHVSRQKIAKHLNKLVKEGLVNKEGSTRNSSYRLRKTKKSSNKTPSIDIIRNLKDLKEDKVYEEVEQRMPELRRLPSNVGSIAFYAFGEMLNNAIDHSESKKASIEVGINADNFIFIIKDFGIGIFANVREKFDLKNEFEALEHVLKGKQTTDPEHHSGQGIFFTSKIADLFKIKSHQIELTIDNVLNDFRVKEIRNAKGTEVTFQIKKRSRKILRDLFMKFANNEYEFDRTRVKIKLTAERELLARSQAKRVMTGLENYKIIILDFNDVKEVGQGFIDEIFRVFKKRHPAIQILYENANQAVEFMIQRQFNSQKDE